MSNTLSTINEWIGMPSTLQQFVLGPYAHLKEHGSRLRYTPAAFILLPKTCAKQFNGVTTLR